MTPDKLKKFGDFDSVMFIDIETYSEIDLKKAGAYRYAEESEVLLLGVAYGNGPVLRYQVIHKPLPEEIVDDMFNPRILKVAHNAPFERCNLAEHLGAPMPPEQWLCTSVLSSQSGYPASLGESAMALDLPMQKDKNGAALIKYFCVPCKPTKVNGGRTRNLPEHAPEKWGEFVSYLDTDVVVCRDIFKKLIDVPMTKQERDLWILDQHITDRGVKIETRLAAKAVELGDIYLNRMKDEAKEITGLQNPNSLQQLTAWIKSKEPSIEIASLDKEHVLELLKIVEDEDVIRVLNIRQDTAKSSNKKYVTMLIAAGAGGRVRGLLQFCGANRTHRWAGRLIQIQNLPRISIKNKDLDICRELVMAGDLEMLEICFDAPPKMLSQLLRTALIPAKGHRFIVSDYSAIEARVIAWLAHEQWRLDVFEKGGDIYIESAAMMFGLDPKTIPKKSPLRQQGKVGELAGGFGGGENAFRVMDTANAIPDHMYKQIVKDWRAASPRIVLLWRSLQKAAIATIRTGNRHDVYVEGNNVRGVHFTMEGTSLLMWLPSGRALHYPEAYTKNYIKKFVNDEGEEYEREVTVIHFKALHQESKNWITSHTYGGKLAENLTQAIARDCLAQGLLNLDAVGYCIVGHVHDEAICEMPIGKGSITEMNKLMAKKAPWMEGLPLGTEGFETSYYKKDED